MMLLAFAGLNAPSYFVLSHRGQASAAASGTPQFSLRALLAVTAAVAIALAYERAATDRTDLLDRRSACPRALRSSTAFRITQLFYNDFGELVKRVDPSPSTRPHLLH